MNPLFAIFTFLASAGIVAGCICSDGLWDDTCFCNGVLSSSSDDHDDISESVTVSTTSSTNGNSITHSIAKNTTINSTAEIIPLLTNLTNNATSDIIPLLTNITTEIASSIAPAANKPNAAFSQSAVSVVSWTFALCLLV